MDQFNRLMTLANDEKVQFAADMPKELHKSLILGQSRWVCRYGTLSDGHERITDSQRYYGAIKEMYVRSITIAQFKIQAMEYQADIIDAEKALSYAKTESDKLRCEAAVLKARLNLSTTLTQVEDRMRELDEFNRIRLELKDKVEAQYPHGIEQAEEDNWKAVYLYRMQKEKTPGLGRERTDNIPLDPVSKAALGLEFGRLDSTAPLQISDTQSMRELNRLFNESKQQITHVTEKK